MANFLKIKLLLNLIYLLTLSSCSTKKQINYFQDAENTPPRSITKPDYKLQPNDILKIDVYSSDMQAALPYNKPGAFNNQVANATLQSLQLDGYMVDDYYNIKFPVIGEISVKNKSLKKLEENITILLDTGGHLREPIVSIRLLNARFTVLGEVRSPGTFSFFDNNLSILQALGYSGGITIDGVRNEIILIREIDDKRTIQTIDLTDAKSLDISTYYIRPNDVIIIPPNYRKVKSAGFIGNPSSIASISSLLLSITLLLIN
ncbi:MAG: polysaccharide export protein [Flavobacteriales bacterium]|nr:polysaccharide export protein [Flavobacteriales bacterium]